MTLQYNTTLPFSCILLTGAAQHDCARRSLYSHGVPGGAALGAVSSAPSPRDRLREVQYSAVQYSTLQYSAVRYVTIQCIRYNTVQYVTIQCSTIQCRALRYREENSAEQCRAVEWSRARYNAVQCSTVRDSVEQCGRVERSKVG